MKRQTAAAAALTLLTALGLSACGDEATQDASTQTKADESSATTDHNGADLTFVRSMIPHHEQAVQMAKMARAGAGSDEVRDLARRIEAAQGPEIEEMQGWLEDWGDEGDSGADHDGMDGMDGMDHGDGMDASGMPGMMSDGDLEDLDAASGAGFDRMFLTMMIAHHEGAIEMAETEQADGENAEAKALARQIEAAQTKEIAEMKRLLGG